MGSPGLLCPALVGLFGRFLPLVSHGWVLNFRPLSLSLSLSLYLSAKVCYGAQWRFCCARE